MNNAITVLETHKAKLAERFTVAPSWMSFDAEYGFALQHINGNQYLADIAAQDKSGLLAALSNVAACGLSLNPAKKEAYLIPRKGRICLDPSYMGICRLATDTGSVVWIQAKLVHEHDEIILHGVDEKPTHNVRPFGDRGEIVGVYCVAKIHDGSYLTEVMSREDIDDIMNRSESVKKGKSSPWKTDYGEMAKKTVVKRAAKMWPRSDNHNAEFRLAQAIDVSHQADDVELTKTLPALGGYSDETKAYYDQLIEQSDALGMYVFQETTPAAARNDLYHSFVSAKGKFQRVVDELHREGFATFNAYLEQYTEALQNGDDSGIQELEAELSEGALALILERARPV